MRLPPTMLCGDALIVFEEARRVRVPPRDPWASSTVALWPDASEAVDVRRRLAQGQPILVVLGGPQADAALLVERFAQAPPALARSVNAIARDLAGGPVPALDWLPGELRDHGLRFLRESTERARRTPTPLCASLYLDERDLRFPHVRFAHRIRQCLESARDLALVVDHAFSAAALPR